MSEYRPSATRCPQRAVWTSWLAACFLALPSVLATSPHAFAQSVLDRPPDLGGTWVGTPGTLYFDFNHRFTNTGAPARKVVNSPTFLLGAALPGNLLVGVRYATNSVLVAGYPNEWEFFGRYGPLSQIRGAPVDLAVHGGYNQAARSWDGEVEVARRIGPVRLLAAGRGYSNYRRDGSRWAVAGGATIRLQQFIAIAGDVGTLTSRSAGEDIAWGAGLQLQIPYTPHTLSLQVSNTPTTTLEGASLGSARGRRWGFEFTVPLTLSRYFGGRRPSAGTAPSAGPTPLAAAAVVTLTNQLRFDPDTVRIRVGQTVVWRNASALIHTVTADPSKVARPEDVHVPDGARPFSSGDLKPGMTFSHTFTVPGEYRYFCIPHELGGMVAIVIVEGT